MARSSTSLAFVSLLCASCVSVQDFGATGAPDASDATDGSGGVDASDADAAPGVLGPGMGGVDWSWMNPAPTGDTLYAISGTSSQDIWVAGAGGIVAHFNGTSWDIRHSGPIGTRYFALGTKMPGDVWVAGEDSNAQLSVLHFNGTAWVESYPFAGSSLTAFSHGSQARLFAVTGVDILELSANGTWMQTDTGQNFGGPPIDVWVAPSGDSFAITAGGADILELPAGSQQWQAVGSVSSVPSSVVGLGISGAASSPCLFYTGRTAGSGLGFSRDDGQSWDNGPEATDPVLATMMPQGSTTACLADGTGVLANGDVVFHGSTTATPEAHAPFTFPGETAVALWSPDGSFAYAVGTLGAFAAFPSGQADDGTPWQELGPTIRNDLPTVDVGLDGTVMAVDANGPDPSAGGDVLSWSGAWKKTVGKGGLEGPSVPIGITVVSSSDAWVLANDDSQIGVAHFTGAWGDTEFLDSMPSENGDDALAVWAPAKDDVWVTGSEHCPDLTPMPNVPCSQPLQAFAWHYDGGTWNPVPVSAAYRSIHGTGPSDVWFAGDALAHWDGHALTSVPSVVGRFSGVWSSVKGRVWLWGDHAILYDGQTSVPLETVLKASAEWVVGGIAEDTSGDLFVLTTQATGSSLLWFDASHTTLVQELSSDLTLTTIRGRGDQLWVVGLGGASLSLTPTTTQ